MKIDWPPEYREKLHELIADTPLGYRKHLAHAEDAVLFQAKKLGKSQIDDEAIVRGYITAVPRHLRDGITEILTQHNYDLLYFRPVFDEPEFLPKQNHTA